MHSSDVTRCAIAADDASAAETLGMPNKRQDAIHAFHILNYFVGDLVAASQVRRLFQSPDVTSKVSSTTVACVNRMSLGYLFLTLDKWTEFYERFRHVIPDDCRSECKSLFKEVRRRKIKGFRNTFVGHIWDKKRGRPLTEIEIEAAVDAIVDGDQEAFSTWCNNHERNEYPDTVVSIVEHTRDRLREDFKLTQAELGRARPKKVRITIRWP